jgi:alanyl-tRNA synthetase
MTTTARLYHDDAYLRRFDATVTRITTLDGKPAVILDRTAFYPEAGGQLGDRGTLAGVAVLDTQEQDNTIVHVLAGDAPPIGSSVIGELDWTRRRQHMAQHTAQHLLSGTLLDRATAPTASARLGESALTIDVARDRIPEADLAAAEDLANDLIDDDLAIRAWFPDPTELAAIKLRRDPKVTADIRVVAIGDYDFSPCGGTHCARTGQLGTIRILNTERYKGMTRITFTAARRGRSELFTRDHILRTLATQFSCGPAEVPAAIDKLRRDVASADATITAMRSKLADALLSTFTGTDRVIADVPDAELARSVAAKLVAAGRDALLAVRIDDGTQVVLFRAAGSTLDCGALFKQLSAKYGGRGGGKPDRAEGKLATQLPDWPAAIAKLA